MSKLILACHLGIDYRPNPPSKPSVFQRVTQGPELSTEAVTLSYRIDKLTKIYEGDYTTVYRASLFGSASGETCNVVLKTDVNARYPRTNKYNQEALRYEKDLTQLQGIYIPRCYGLFQATMYNKLVSVLLLEDCGESINVRDGSLAKLEKTQIFELFSELHVTGFAHHDAEERNIVKNQDGKFFLIDLENSRPHKCGVRLYVLAGDFAPSEEEFGCSELHKVAMTLDLWLPEDLNFYGHEVPVCAYKKGEAKNLLALLPSHMLKTEEDHQAVLQQAEEMIEDVEAIQAHYAKVPDPRRYTHPSFYPKQRSASESQAPA